MPKSFLISRRRKLSSSATEPPQKSSRIVKPYIHSEDNSIQFEFSVTSDPRFENHFNKTHSKAEKYLLFSRKISENKSDICRPNNVQYFQVPLETSRHDFTNDNNGNTYFQSLAANVTTNHWKNSRIEDDTGKYSHLTAKEDSIRGDKTATDNNNNITVHGNNDVRIPSEFPAERTDKPFVDRSLNSDLTFVNHVNVLQDHASSIHQAAKYCSDQPSFPPSRLVTITTDAKADQFQKELPPEMSTIEYLPTSNKNSFESTRKHQTMSGSISQIGLPLNLNETQQASISKSNNNSRRVKRDLGLSEQIIAEELSAKFSEDSRRREVSENKMTSLTSDAGPALSSQLLSLSRPNGTICYDGCYAKRVSCLRGVCDGGVWQFGGTAESATDYGNDGKNREMDIANTEEGHRDLHQMFSKNQSNYSSMYSPLPQPIYNPRNSPPEKLSLLVKSQKKISACDCAPFFEAAQQPVERQERHTNDNNISNTSLSHPFGKSITPLSIENRINHSPTNAHLNLVRPSDSLTKSSPGETLNLINYLPDLELCPLTSPLLPSRQKNYATNQETNSALNSSQSTKTDICSAQKLSDEINNKEILNDNSPEKPLLKHQPQPTKMKKHRKRHFKSFMISNIIHDSSDSEEDENQPFPAVDVDCYKNSSNDLFATIAAPEAVQNITTSTAGINFCDKQHLNKSSNNCTPSSPGINLCDKQHLNKSSNNCTPSSERLKDDYNDLDKQIIDDHRPHHKRSTDSPDIILQQDKKYNSHLSLINPLKLQKNYGTNVTSTKHTSSVSVPLTNGSRGLDVAGTKNVPSKDSRLNSLPDENVHQKSNKATDEILSVESFIQAQKLDLSIDAQIKNESPTPVQIDYLRLPEAPLHTDLMSGRIIHPDPMNAHTWRRTVNGVYNPMPMRYYPVPTFFNILTPALHCQSSLSSPKYSELSNTNLLTISKHIDHINDSFLSLKDTMRQSPGCDASSNVSSGSSLTSSSILSPISSHGSSIIHEEHGFNEVSRQLFQNKDNLCPKNELSYCNNTNGQKPETNESKSFKSILEQRRVKLECINGGNGIKNPLLNTDFVGNKLGLVPVNCALSCPVCNLTFDLAKHLQKHLKSHREIKRFLCSFCGKGFNDTFDLKRHTRTHTGVRPYKCNQCDKAFTQRCSLESHCRKIHGLSEQLAFNERRLKVYVCEVCGHSTDHADDHYTHNRLAHPTSQLKRRVSM